MAQKLKQRNCEVVGKYVMGILANLPKTYSYHDLAHTLDVYNNAMMIANYYDLSFKSKVALCKATLLHDLGYLKQYKQNESIGADLAGAYLLDLGDGLREINLVRNLILATALENQPKNLLEEIISDADLANLGRGDFFTKSINLMYELRVHDDLEISVGNWFKSNYLFLNSHEFKTDYAKEVFAPRQNENILLLEGFLDKIDNSSESDRLLTEFVIGKKQENSKYQIVKDYWQLLLNDPELQRAYF